MKNVKNSFGVRIADLRMQKNITQKKAAEDLGISAAQLSHYEKGIRECSLSFVLKLAEYYDVSCDYLLGKETSLNSSSFDRKLYSNEAENAIYSIASYLRDAINNEDITRSEERVLMLIALLLYRIILFSAKNGCIPKEWVSSLKFENPNYANAVDGIIEVLLYEKLKGRITTSEEPAPESINKIIRLAENYVNGDLRTLANLIE